MLAHSVKLKRTNGLVRTAKVSAHRSKNPPAFKRRNKLRTPVILLKKYKPLIARKKEGIPNDIYPSRLPPEVTGPGMTPQRAKKMTRTWAHAGGNTHPTTVYQLLNCHWPTNNTFNLKRLKDFIQQIKRLDGGEQPVFLAVRALEGLSLCPGADLVDLLKHDVEYRKEFYRTAYQACYITATTRTPLMMCMQGNVMGLGAGLTMHAPYFRLVFPNAVWAMPNTLYGAFPDCGSTWVLPRLRGEVGMYLGLTGKRLESTDILDVGIGSHTMTVDSFEDLNRMSTKIYSMFDIFNVMEHIKRHQFTASAIVKFLPAINRCFSKDTLEEVVTALEEEKEQRDWARNILCRLRMCSPLMLHVTFRQLKLGKYITTVEEAFHLEYRIARKMVSSHDFEEGIRARVIERRLPKWKHKDIYSVPNDEITEFLKMESKVSDILHLEPCQPGFRPARDPFVAYDLEFNSALAQSSISQLASERALERVSDRHVTSQSLHEFYKDLFKEEGMAEDAARAFAQKYRDLDPASIRQLKHFTGRATITPAVFDALAIKQFTKHVNNIYISQAALNYNDDWHDWWMYKMFGTIDFKGGDGLTGGAAVGGFKMT